MPLGSLRHRPVYELSREDGHSISAFEANRRRNGIVDANRLSPEEAVRRSRAMRAKALKPILPDSTEAIRSDRDRR